jgi:hypothetical protein
MSEALRLTEDCLELVREHRLVAMERRMRNLEAKLERLRDMLMQQPMNL